ncbi:Long chronological lifespan protein 2 [Elasticomyces elasticus]|nr:Long chronological lifespan protein 2 [Elasticomyces elasticus]
MDLIHYLTAFLFLVLPASAQFQFFEHVSKPMDVTLGCVPFRDRRVATSWGYRSQLVLSADLKQECLATRMFGGQQQQQAQPQNAGSDSAWFQQQYEAAHCDKYLCPATLSCVHFPHHCPCAFPAVEDKVEFGDGSMVCVSKGGWAEGEASRKIELARKGLI